MAIEDFEWEGDLQEARPALAPSVSNGASGAPEKPRWLARLRSSVWLEPALRLTGMALLLGVLSGIGVVATTYAKPGAKLPEGSRLLTDALGTSWLKPTAPESSVEHPHAHAAPPPSVAVATAAAPPVAASPVPEPPPGSSAPAGITPEGKVILNLASAEELTKLPGVGLKRATAIVALRTKLKRFKQATDLLRVKGIGPRGLKRMLPHLVLDPPAAAS